jgi:hypothetical protein
LWRLLLLLLLLLLSGLQLLGQPTLLGSSSFRRRLLTSSLLFDPFPLNGASSVLLVQSSLFFVDGIKESIGSGVTVTFQ